KQHQRARGRRGAAAAAVGFGRAAVVRRTISVAAGRGGRRRRAGRVAAGRRRAAFAAAHEHVVGAGPGTPRARSRMTQRSDSFGQAVDVREGSGKPAGRPTTPRCRMREPAWLTGLTLLPTTMPGSGAVYSCTVSPKMSLTRAMRSPAETRS